MILEAALACRVAGLSVLPAHLAEKRPALSGWKPFQEHLPGKEQVCAWFKEAEAICIVTGKVSGNLEMMDFDNGGELFDRWAGAVKEQSPGLIDRLVIESSQSGGRHVAYRCRDAVCGNLKLAQRRLETPGGKQYVHRKDADGNQHVIQTLIETRGEGGLFLCAPSPGYKLLQGDFTHLPVLTPGERDVLLSAAWALNEYIPPPEPIPTGCASLARPGDDYSARGDVRAVLVKHGWTLAKPGENEYWRRPGKTNGWSATLKDRIFYVFSSNAAPFEPNKAYSPFAVYAHLEHNGDFAAAARALRAEGYGGDEPAVNLTGIVAVAEVAPPAEPTVPDPGQMPEDLLRVPGFVSEVMDYCLQTAPYPNTVMAFCGALALQAFLAGRKVRDPGDNRTNVYLLGLAHSAAGKDHPRKVNTRIVHEIGLASCLGDRFASGEGIQDALFIKPCMLFQTDEIDGMLQQINKAQDARHENIMSTLLSMYSAANSIFPMRRKAGKESPGAIDQPCLALFGTAIPNHYYEALSERMLTNGFFARMIILESGPRPEGQEPHILDLPPRIIATAKWWADFHPGSGNLENWHPVPRIVEQTEDAKRVLVEARLEAEDEYARAEKKGDPVGTTVWGRVSEQTRKLALIHAVSEDHESPCIGLAAAEWATRFVMHQTRRMLFMARSYVAENPFHAECLKLMQKLRASPDKTLSHSKLLKRMKMDARNFQELVTTLLQRGDIAIVNSPQVGHGGRPTLEYRLTEQAGEA